MRRWLHVGLFLVLQHVALSAVVAAPGLTSRSVAASHDKAKQLAVAGFRKAIGNRIKKFGCSLLQADSRSWVFACENLDGLPYPGSTAFVEVDKKTGKVNLVWGI